jgi:Flagellar protein FliT
MMHTSMQAGKVQQRDDAWHAILHASETLLNAAQEANWDELTALANERDILIRTYFSKPVTVDNALQIRDKITQLLSMDDQVLGLARKEHENLLPALRAFSKSKKAIGAYQEIGG